ncbi:MAG: hypothetical protein ABIG66_02155 [Candidatus Kerfeldbacteria bacterium]
MIVQELVALWRNQHKSPEELRQLQWWSLQSSISHAFASVPFYQSGLQGKKSEGLTVDTLADLQHIPVTKKSDVQKAGDAMVARPFVKEQLKMSTSSGSTGQPVSTYFNTSDWLLLKYAAKIRSKLWCGMRFGDVVVTVDDRPTEEVREKNSWLARNVIRRHMLSIDQPLSEHLDFYRRVKPDVLYGSPSYMYELAAHVKEHGVDWFRPRLIFTSSELIQPRRQEELERTFGCRAYDVYGSTEFKEIAVQCPCKNGYHINSDLFYVEMLNNGKPVAPGEEGDIIVTSLKNRAMPLIRYDIGDRGVLRADECGCGNPFPLMDVVLGRCVDYVKAGDRHIAPYTLTNVLQDCCFEHIAQYQVVQDDADHITVFIEPNTSYAPVVKSTIREELQKVLGTGMAISVQEVDSIPREASGKYCVVKSSIHKDHV